MHDALMLPADFIYIITESLCVTVPVCHVYSSQPQSLEEILKKKKQEREEAAKVMAEFFACMHASRDLHYGYAPWMVSIALSHCTACCDGYISPSLSVSKL